MNITATRQLARSAVAALVLLVAAGQAQPAAPTPVSARGYKPYPPITLTSYVFEKPRPIRAWSVRVDLTSPDVELVTTPPGEFAGVLETACATTTEFAAGNDLQLAVNATPFTPARTRSGEGMDVLGLAARDGQVFSPPHRQYGALVVTREGRAEIWPPPIDERRLDQVDDAIGGYHVLLEKGRSRVSVVSAGLPPDFVAPQPRTAIGLSNDGRILWILVVDGRNRGRSEGMTLGELADWGLSLGCADLLNMDGGGSTTLALEDPASKAVRLVNQPVGRGILGTERLVGSHLGVRVRSRQTDAPRSTSSQPIEKK